MRPIILASKSKARRKLLATTGLRFRVVASNIREPRKLKSGCGDFVISVALKKARSVERNIKKGIVIAADTVVLAGGKIIGKPRNLKEAIKSLRVLSKKPQWVYTGIAVIDIDNDKIYTDYEKTKVYMYTLTERQIRKYFTKISPYDKAGAFDVQGPGSFFIDRIEGCFYNVVGLPLGKIAKILKKLGVALL